MKDPLRSNPQLPSLAEERPFESYVEPSVLAQPLDVSRPNAPPGTGDPGPTLTMWMYQLIERLERLDPLFSKLKQYQAPPRERVDMPFLTFEQGMITELLLLCFKQALLARLLFYFWAPPLPSLDRKAKRMRLLLKEHCSPSEREFLSSRLGVTQKIIQEQSQRQRRLGGKCPTISIAVTLLADYLSQCVSFQSTINTDSDAYETIAMIMREISTPYCLACGHEHKFVSWRNAKARDQHKGPWKTRHLRVIGEVGGDFIIRGRLVEIFDLLLNLYLNKPHGT